MNNNSTISNLFKKVWALTALLLCSMTIVAQQAREVTGVVTSATGEALAGVSVLVEGTNKGVTTNNKGQYSIHSYSVSK